MAKVEIKELTSRDVDYSQWYNELVIKADLAETSAVRGCMVIKPYGYAIWEKMQAELEAQKAQLIAQIDTKLADSVVAFLVETLQHDVDLGAQTQYLTKMLDEHKADFSGKVKDEG